MIRRGNDNRKHDVDVSDLFATDVLEDIIRRGETAAAELSSIIIVDYRSRSVGYQLHVARATPSSAPCTGCSEKTVPAELSDVVVSSRPKLWLCHHFVSAHPQSVNSPRHGNYRCRCWNVFVFVFARRHYRSRTLIKSRFPTTNVSLSSKVSVETASRKLFLREI